jgi:lipopolysaccharide/colanic/teichoic acid biosynthesis glycosyltransferase
VVDSVLEDGVVVEQGATVARSVVLSGTRVGAGEVLADEAGYLGVRVGAKGLRAAPSKSARRLRRRRISVAGIVSWIVALLLLFVSLPLMLLCSLAILIETGWPVFFVHPRVGQERRGVSRDGSRRIVKVVKFRTMYTDGDPRRAGPEWKDDDDEAIFQLAKDDEDPRLTKVGRFLRRTSLDEIPQLFNVLKGDMRIVGNRPLAVSEADRMTEEWHQERFRAPQGITGLWQVSGRSNLTDEERLALDNYYASSHSLWLDVRILLRTVPAVLFRRGAK